MRRLVEIGNRGQTRQSLPRPDMGEAADSNADDRSLGAVIRDIARILSGWLFVVIAVQLLLHGTGII